MSDAELVDGAGLRERLPQKPDVPQKAESVGIAQEAVEDLNKLEQNYAKPDGEKRTYGRTPDGTVFTVPHTEDMVSQLFNPAQPKNASDIAIVIILACMCLLYNALPMRWRSPVFAVIFLFWRTCYNAGIGWLLHNQSHHKRLVVWAKKYRIFDKNAERPTYLYGFLKREMESKIPKDYKFEEAPIEYNTWLLFRRVVDLILMSDFTSYCLFAISCSGRPAGEKLPMTIARWVGGIALILFNLWVKLDAHRVVKDFAWYWGDFFYLIDQELTFDGVFELAPHPMYSVGYAGFYGISMLAASYKVLFISIIAHAAQLIFLSLVESPHIERTYNRPSPVKRRTEVNQTLTRPQYRSRLMSSGDFAEKTYEESTRKPSTVRNLIGMHNMDLHRVTDVAVVMLQAYMYSVALLSPSSRFWQGLFILNATIWRLWHSIGIGFILVEQSTRKSWTRHFLKYGESTDEAWHQWKGIFHLSMTMCYTSFICAAWKMYGLPADWTYSMSTLRHVIGIALIALQLWTISEIYESLGEFGWFFGDFFFDSAGELTYGGIYRFLNNPERTIGLAGLWGAAIITWSRAIFFLTLLSHVLTLCFIQFVERPHMQKLYRQSIRETSGVSRNLQTILPSPLYKWRGGMDRVWDDSVDFIEELIDAAKPRLASEFSTFVKNSRSLFKAFPARISITRLSPDLAGYDMKDYSLKIEEATLVDGGAETLSRDRDHSENAQSQTDRRSSTSKMIVGYGVPLRVRWTAPVNHSKYDWIGMYQVGDNSSSEVTKVSSQGRWVATNKDSFEYASADVGIITSDQRTTADLGGDSSTEVFEGEVVFSGDKLWWSTGVFEFRYHHDGRHNVMAVSRPFTIQVVPFNSADPNTVPGADHLDATAVEEALLPLIQNCFDRDPDIAPRDVTEHYGSAIERNGKFARRVVYAVSAMFGIDFAPEVVQADGNVRNLSRRICNAKEVLAPYSTALKRGWASPV